MSAQTPSSIGRYTIDRLLGQGAMGLVYLGRDPHLERKVAIKTVRALDLDEERTRSFLERFRNEARAAARLSHPSIVAVHDVGEQEGVGPYLVLEYVPGTTLKHVVRSRGGLPWPELLSFARQLAGALDAAHAAGILHRDVKPDNVLVTEDGRAKLADFGVARVPDAALTKEGQFLGTPCYAAPETLSSARYSTRSDQFSFAAVLYELVCGERAFPGDDALSVAHSVIHDVPPPPGECTERSVPRGIDAVVMRGLAKDPAARFESATELVDALEHVLVEHALVEPPSVGKPAPRTSSGARSGPWLAVLAVGLLVGTGLVFGLGELPAFGFAVPIPDGGVTDADGGAVPRGRASPIRVEEPVEVDAGLPSRDVAADAGRPDSGPPDAGAAPMTRLEREDAAKDAIDRARARLSDGELDRAAHELDAARALDPGSSDLEELDARLRLLRAASP